MNPVIEILNRKIGLDHDPLIIAEIGINHAGNITTAKKMVDAAEKAGVEIIKHQTHIVEDEMSYQAKSVIPGHTKESIYDIIESCSLSINDEIELQNYVINKNMIFISTPFSRAAADQLELMNVPAYKIGSGECNNYPLIEHIAEFKKPIILSTGMNDIKSIRESVQILRKNNIQYALLHCTNIYPTPPHLVRLEAMRELSDEFPDAVVGLSDHTTDNLACFGAVALGASILERHFTDNMDRIGPDIINSMDGNACSELIKGSKILKLERGGHKGPVKEEQPTIDFAYASVVTINDIKKGEVFNSKNLWVKRPGTGPLYAENYSSILGMKASKDINKDTHLQKSQIEDFDE